MKRRTLRAAAAAPGMPEAQTSLDLSSLVDIAFLLLTFFLLTSTLDPKEADLGFRLGLPGIVQPPKNSFVPEEVRVEVRADGSVWYQGEAVESGATDRRQLPGLLSELRDATAAAAMLAPDEENGVVVRVSADDQVRGQRLMDVLDTIAGSGIATIRLDGFVD